MRILNKMFTIGIFAIIFCAFSINSNSQLLKTVVSVTGTVYNEVTKKPVSVKITVNDVDGHKLNSSTSNSKDGYYLVTSLKPGVTYMFKVEEKGYFTQSFKISIPKSDKYFEISRDLLVKPLVENELLTVRIPPFELNKSQLRNGADFILEELTYTLINNPRVEFTILSYPDLGKDKKFNAKMTDERANTLKEYFMNKGVQLKRMTSQGSAIGDTKDPIPTEKRAKGKRYIGPVYIKITKF